MHFQAAFLFAQEIGKFFALTALDILNGIYSIGQKKSAMAKKWFGFSAIFSSALQCCF
jgi:hypothetical protein